MNDLEIIVIGSIIFWAYVAWWIIATDPLAGSVNNRVFKIVNGTLKFIGVVLLFLAIQGLIQEFFSKRHKS